MVYNNIITTSRKKNLYSFVISDNLQSGRQPAERIPAASHPSTRHQHTPQDLWTLQVRRHPTHWGCPIIQNQPWAGLTQATSCGWGKLPGNDPAGTSGQAGSLENVVILLKQCIFPPFSISCFNAYIFAKMTIVRHS